MFWHPKGWAIWQVVEQYMRKVYRDSGYQEVRCPQILDVSLWKRSGHWDNYQDNMFFTESEKRTYAVKPMNCPGHVQVFNQGLHSYRDLPIRYGEFGACHRNEPSGALHGILRVRGFTQDDGHIFCTEDQIEAEVTAFHQQALKVYSDFGFEDIQIKIALRPDSRLGDDATWDKAEDSLRSALREDPDAILVGELRCIIGPNGAGKTTMMDIITGKTRPDEGTVMFGGSVDLTRLDEAAIARMSRPSSARR